MLSISRNKDHKINSASQSLKHFPSTDCSALFLAFHSLTFLSSFHQPSPLSYHESHLHHIAYYGWTCDQVLVPEMVAVNPSDSEPPQIFLTLPSLSLTISFVAVGVPQQSLPLFLLSPSPAIMMGNGNRCRWPRTSLGLGWNYSQHTSGWLFSMVTFTPCT
jgi:hypothetical protein